jgi:hypothetical protein
VKLFGRGKLRTKWDGPFYVINTASHGANTLQDESRNIFKANGQCPKLFLKPKMPKLKELDLI